MDNYRDIFLIQQIYATLFSLSNKLQIQGDKYSEGLTSRQFMAMLAVIHLSENETTLNNIARKLGTTKQSVKQLITIIENKGYIMTIPSDQDKRAVNVKITESGRKAMLHCYEKSLNFLADISKNLTTDEMETLWNLLKKLYCFDGEERDEFVENIQLQMDIEETDLQIRAIKEFERRRNDKASKKQI